MQAQGVGTVEPEQWCDNSRLYNQKFVDFWLSYQELTWGVHTATQELIPILQGNLPAADIPLPNLPRITKRLFSKFTADDCIKAFLYTFGRTALIEGMPVRDCSDTLDLRAGRRWSRRWNFSTMQIVTYPSSRQHTTHVIYDCLALWLLNAGSAARVLASCAWALQFLHSSVLKQQAWYSSLLHICLSFLQKPSKISTEEIVFVYTKPKKSV